MRYVTDSRNKVSGERKRSEQNIGRREQRRKEGGGRVRERLVGRRISG